MSLGRGSMNGDAEACHQRAAARWGRLRLVQAATQERKRKPAEPPSSQLSHTHTSSRTFEMLQRLLARLVYSFLHGDIDTWDSTGIPTVQCTFMCNCISRDADTRGWITCADHRHPWDAVGAMAASS